MQIIFAEIFVPPDFTIRLLLGSVDPQAHVPTGQFTSVPSAEPYTFTDFVVFPILNFIGLI